MKRDQTEALFVQDFFFNNFCNRVSKARIMPNAQNSLPRLLQDRVFSVKQINSQKGNVSLLIGETLASVLACQQ